MRFGLGFFVLASVVGLASVGCDALRYTKPHEGQANGAARTLYFTDVDDANVGTVPLGGFRTVRVARYSPGTVSCAKFPASPEESNVKIQGGPSIPPDRCTSLEADAVELVSASCGGDACTVTSTIEGDTIALRVVGKEATTTKLEVTLKKRDTGEPFTDSVAIGFAKAGKIALRGASELGVPMVVGAETYLPNAHLLDEKGNEMSIDDGAMVRTRAGDALSTTDSDFARAKAIAPGKTSLVWEVAGVLRREETVEVVAESAVRKLEAFALPESAKVVTDVETKAAWLSSSPLARVEASSREQTTVIVAARLNDDRIALVSPTSGRLLPEALGSVEVYPQGSFVIFPASPPVVGEGTIAVRAGGLEATFDLVMR